MAKTILVVDDEPNIIRLVQMNLERNGYAVVAAADGYEALQRVDEAVPDLILLDVMMPHMDGFEVLKRLKQNPQTRDVPVIMLTVRAQDPDLFEGEDRGADVYLTKPVNPAELIMFVNRVLGADAGS